MIYTSMGRGFQMSSKRVQGFEAFSTENQLNIDVKFSRVIKYLPAARIWTSVLSKYTKKL